MATDPRPTGYLARALSHEMAAVQQYLALTVMWRLGEHSRRFRGDVEEELGHLRDLDRMLTEIHKGATS